MPERTKRDIVSAFNRLIVRTEIEKITTQKIAEEAGVSKAPSTAISRTNTTC